MRSHPPQRRRLILLARRSFLLASPALLLGSPLHGQTAAPARPGLAVPVNRLCEQFLSEQAAGSGAGMVSSLSLLDAMAPLAISARGAAEGSFAAVLGREPSLRTRLTQFHEAVGPSDALTRSVAVWLPPDRSPSPEVAEGVRSVGGNIEAIDLAGSDALTRINAWVAEATRGRITELLDRLPSNPGVVITSALFFAATWERQFDPADTRNRTFTRNNGRTIQVPFISGKQSAPYASGRTCHAIRLPYADPNFELVLLAPRGRSNPNEVSQLVARRTAGSTLATMQFQPVELDVSLPKVSITSSMDLLPALRRTGLADAFAPGADYEQLAGGPVRITAVR